MAGAPAARHRDRALRHRPATRRRRKQEQVSDVVDALIKDLSELKVGDPVVHINHGIGRYPGLMNIDLGDGPSEFLHLEYADKATLYVPVSQLHLIGRYTGVSAEEARCTAGLRPVGEGQAQGRRAGARHRPPSCSTSTPAAARAREGHAFRYSAARLRGLCRQLRL